MKAPLIIFVFSLITTVSLSQTVNYGVKGGVNLSTQIDDRYQNPKNLAGFQFGGLINIEFKKFSLQPQLLFITKGKSLYNIPNSADAYKETQTYNYVQIPIKALYRLKATDFLTLNAGFGPYIAYALGGLRKARGESSSIDFGNSTSRKPLDYGASFTTGALVNNNLLLSLDYDLGIENILRTAPGVTGYAIKNRTIGFSVGYLFK